MKPYKLQNMGRTIAALTVSAILGASAPAQEPSCSPNLPDPPEFSSGAPIIFTITVTDPDGGVVEVVPLDFPLGSTLEPLTGESPLEVTFTWPSPEVGLQFLSLGVLDGIGSDDGNFIICEIVFTVTENVAPTANDDPYSVDEDQTLVVAASGVLTNDSDPERVSLSAALVTGTLNGVVSLNSNGSFSYTPNPDFSGIDFFTYKASDGIAESNEATVTITVIEVPEPPPDFCSSLSPIVTAVMDLADDSSIPKKVRKHIKGAAKHLEKALEHCGDERLEKTFHQIDHAIFELERAIHRSENSDLDTQLVGIIDELVGLIVAKTEEVVAAAVAADPDNKHTKKAQKHLEKGLKHLTAGRLHRAIDEFIKAVHHALKVVGDDGLFADGSNEVLGSPETLTPLSYKLDQNYPNPFNPSTVISYELADESIVWLKVYDVLGRLVASLADEVQSAGRHEVELDGSYLPSGVYFYRLQVQTDSGLNNFVETKKMVLAK